MISNKIIINSFNMSSSNPSRRLSYENYYKFIINSIIFLIIDKMINKLLFFFELEQRVTRFT